jgi:small acid-soluble spore protein F (minor alpha/beta-type SASP)
MSRRRGLMSEHFKEELAKELGFYDKVKQNGWGEITANEAGSMVKRAVQIAEESMKRDNT